MGITKVIHTQIILTLSYLMEREVVFPQQSRAPYPYIDSMCQVLSNCVIRHRFDRPVYKTCQSNVVFALFYLFYLRVY